MKKKLTWKIWVLIFFIVISLISIFGLPPKFLEKGVLITSVEKNSTSFEEGLRQGQVITAIDGKDILNLDDFSDALRGKYVINQSTKTTIQIGDTQIILFSDHSPEITVSNIPKTNIKTGLDLSGGSRALIQAQDRKLSVQEVNDLVAITSNRVNIYGISDVRVSQVSDLVGNNFMLVEIAGATPKDLREILEKQGKFEAKIGNDTVFIGGERDIASVGRDAQNARIESCNPAEGGYICRFSFTIEKFKC